MGPDGLLWLGTLPRGLHRSSVRVAVTSCCEATHAAAVAAAAAVAVAAAAAAQVWRLCKNQAGSRQHGVSIIGFLRALCRPTRKSWGIWQRSAGLPGCYVLWLAICRTLCSVMLCACITYVGLCSSLAAASDVCSAALFVLSSSRLAC